MRSLQTWWRQEAGKRAWEGTPGPDGVGRKPGRAKTVATWIIKEALPDGVNISKEARSAISRAASVFVLYATSCANNFAMKGKRKTLNASDVLSAMEEMEFQRFVTPLKEALEAYRREQKGKKEASEQKKKDKDKKTDAEEQDKSRDEDNDEDEERLEEEEQNEEEEVDN
uniref:DNA polymerase epsilon subunit 3 n=1 Tax=Ailuropoda melanoleuca TaxID=9646 RepID=G1M2X0_AILME